MPDGFKEALGFVAFGTCYTAFSGYMLFRGISAGGPAGRRIQGWVVLVFAVLGFCFGGCVATFRRIDQAEVYFDEVFGLALFDMVVGILLGNLCGYLLAKAWRPNSSPEEAPEPFRRPVHLRLQGWVTLAVAVLGCFVGSFWGLAGGVVGLLLGGLFGCLLAEASRPIPSPEEARTGD